MAAAVISTVPCSPRAALVSLALRTTLCTNSVAAPRLLARAASSRSSDWLPIGQGGVRAKAWSSMSASAAAATADPAAATPEVVASTWEVGGRQTEVLELAASAQPPEVQLLIIPGNPGAAPYYTPFMRSLHARLGGKAAVATVSNLGMDSRGLTPRGTVFSLEQQIEHKVALLKEHFVAPGRPPVIILGHSIGCYMALHATHRLEHHHLASSRADVAALDSVAQQQWEHPPVDGSGGGMEGMQQELLAARAQQGQQGPAAGGRGSDGSGTAGSEGAAAAASNIVKVVGLYPFLQFDPDCSKQLQLQRLTRHHTALARVAAAARLLPLALRRALVRLAAPNLEPHAVDVTVQVFTTPSCVENGLYMGGTEFETLAAPADWWLLHALGRRFAVVVAPGDVWFKQWKWDALHAEVPGVESYWLPAQTHAFCVLTQQSDDLAAKLVPIVEAAATPGQAAAQTVGSRL